MIEKCFKCDGDGSVLVIDDSFDYRPGSVLVRKQIPCPRCRGSGAVEYRIVEAIAPTSNENAGGE